MVRESWLFRQCVSCFCSPCTGGTLSAVRANYFRLLIIFSHPMFNTAAYAVLLPSVGFLECFVVEYGFITSDEICLQDHSLYRCLHDTVHYCDLGHAFGCGGFVLYWSEINSSSILYQYVILQQCFLIMHFLTLWFHQILYNWGC